MDEKTQHLKSDVVASLRKLADDVEAGALLDADIELHNELKNGQYFTDPGAIIDVAEAPNLRQHRNARISIRWADQMPEDQDAPAGLKTAGAGVGMSEETLEKLRQWPGDKGEPVADSWRQSHFSPTSARRPDPLLGRFLRDSAAVLRGSAINILPYERIAEIGESLVTLAGHIEDPEHVGAVVNIATGSTTDGVGK